MQQNQNSLDLNQQTRIPTKGKETIKIRFSIFFDGTLNNKTNLEQRLLASPDNKLTNEERKAAAELTQKTSTKDIKKASELYKRYGAKKKGKDNSYEGYYTNVAIMEKYVESAKNSIYKLNLQTYIEGVGSLDKAKDQRAGFAFAIWHSGLIAKVKSGLSNVVTLIRENHTDKSIIIDEITLDIFGFSRGAAAARSFIFESLTRRNGYR